MNNETKWVLVPVPATPEMIEAAFAGKVEDQDCLAQARRRIAVGLDFAKMVKAAPVKPECPIAVAQRKRDSAEAAELQSYLVGTARTIRPVDGSGLYAWALAALKASAVPS